ncbi:MAG: hypothetical protein U5K69_07060 [Balneolaceae bacterium]|nr:hypothetical protein [Balneolaceae bacterium]
MTAYQRAKYFNEFYRYNGQQPLWSEDALQHFRAGDQPLEYPNTDWAEMVLADNAPKMHHNIAAEGGSENIQYDLSLDYLNQQGLYKLGDLSFKQYQIRARINSQITDNLEIGLNLEGRNGKRHAPLGSGEDLWLGMLWQYPWIAGRWPNGLLGPGQVAGTSPITASNDEYGQRDIDNYVYNGKLSFNYQLPWLTEGLELSGYANFNYRKVDTKTFADIWTAYNYDPETEEYIPSNGYAEVDLPSGERTLNSRQLYEQIDFYDNNLYHLQLSYDTSIGDHNISAFAAYEQSESSYQLISAYRLGLPSDKKVQLFAGAEAEKDNYGSAELGGRVNYFGTCGL